ncbi:MAG: COX15/CtaA family protein [Lysobacteraceae bacterium]|jgi:cytochrome c oxidase assembly protein subunit 15|nr:COX15/CtaA family protein [Xanthomonadaceae bacterium]MCZ8318593.1 COX15/CtaA family protein [Silanimonas sp.]
MPVKHYHRIAWLAVLLTFAVVFLGGFTRLNNAGLSCPDWPTCYGKVTWPDDPHEIAHANATFERAVEVGKAIFEQVHRHLAATLGLMVLLLAVLAVRRKPQGLPTVAVGALLVLASIFAYIKVDPVFALALAGAGQLVWLSGLVRWNDAVARLATGLLMLVTFQALLGMWTVVWLVKPVIVMSHLMGGLTTFSLLVVLAWWTTPNAARVHADAPRLRLLVGIGLVLLAVQIALGGWVAANYAALACGLDFPTCKGSWWPTMDFREGFVLWRGIGVDYEGGVLDAAARAAIQMAHRIGAIVVSLYVGFLAIRLAMTPGFRTVGITLGVLLVAQVALGIGNVVLGLPLWVATAHLMVAVLMLFTVVTLLARLRAPEA